MNVTGAASAMVAQASAMPSGAGAPAPAQAVNDAAAMRGTDSVSLSSAAQAKLQGVKACGSCG